MLTRCCARQLLNVASSFLVTGAAHTFDREVCKSVSLRVGLIMQEYVFRCGMRTRGVELFWGRRFYCTGTNGVNSRCCCTTAGPEDHDTWDQHRMTTCEATPATAQWVEHLTVDARSNQMLPGAVPRCRLSGTQCHIAKANLRSIGHTRI